METERYLYLVTEYASKGEIFGKTTSFVEEREWERGREERKEREGGKREIERERERDGGREREREREGEKVFVCYTPVHTHTPII